MAMRRREDEVFPNAAAVDVGASSHWAAVPPHSTDDAVHEYGVMTADLNAMAECLLACGVDTVVLESTGVYWIPVYEVLEQRALKVWLVDARQIKYVPGRKSDVQDCQWLQKLMSLGLLRAALRPGAEVCVLRAVARQRDTLLEVLSDVMGVTGQAVIRAIVAGQRDAQVLAGYRNGRVKASKDEIARAPRAGSKARVQFDLRQMLANWAGVDLTRINGLGADTVLKLLTEIGPDLSRFASVKPFCSWLGLCPGTKISGGKVLSSGTKRAANRARQALKLAAQSLWHSNSALGAFYRRMQSRTDTAKANTATAHKLARMFYFMLTRGEAFVDQGQQRYEQQQRERSVATLRRRAASLGFIIAPAAAPAPAASI